jgi:hypothetical protein
MSHNEIHELMNCFAKVIVNEILVNNKIQIKRLFALVPATFKNKCKTK